MEKNCGTKYDTTGRGRKMEPDIRRALDITKKQYANAYKNLRYR